MSIKRNIIKTIRPLLSPFINRIRLSDLLFLNAEQKSLEIINGNPFKLVFLSTIKIQDKEYPIIFKRTLFRGDLMIGLDNRQYDKIETQKMAYKEIQIFMAAGAKNKESGLHTRFRHRLIWSLLLALTAVLIIALCIITNIMYMQAPYPTSNLILVNIVYIVAFAFTVVSYRSLQ